MFRSTGLSWDRHFGNDYTEEKKHRRENLLSYDGGGAHCNIRFLVTESLIFFFIPSFSVFKF